MPSVDRIRVLPPSVADRIAAGEVVERPASVVKELLENSLDAQATQVIIEIEGAGTTLIRVSDNGGGIHPDDLHLAVQRFATSKIAEAGDLTHIRSLGFRGEALPSIAAVSQLEVTSATSNAPSGRRIRLAGGEVESQQELGAPPGTMVTVRQLFFNTPARRKFLKSPSREFALIVEAVNRLALSHPRVAFRLVHEGEEILRYPAGRDVDRAAAVLGETMMARSLPVQREADGIAVHGWLGRPELARGSRQQQFLFVNDRPVQSRIVSGAVEQAYHQIIPAGKFPVYALWLEVPRERVDINVHPRKLEVRFDDDHRVFGGVARMVREVLHTAQLMRTMEPAPVAIAGIPSTLALDSAPISAGVVRDAPLAPAGRLPAMRLLGQLHRTYLLAQADGGLIVIDQHAAHERVLYEHLLQARQRGGPRGQLLITPQPVTLGVDETALLTEHREALDDLGFDVEPFGDRTVLIRAVPQIAASTSAERLLRDLLAEAAEGRRMAATQTLLERLTITTACHSAIKAGDPLTAEQMVHLLRELAATEDPFTCFHGRPTMVTLPLEQVDRWFLRR